MVPFSKKITWLVLAALMVMPLTLSAQKKVQITAHRGYWKSEKTKDAENSIASLKLAQKEKLWGSEFDVHLTADNVIVVNHNGDIEGIKIHENPFSAFKDIRLKNGEKVPTLDSYLKQGAKSNTVLVLEIKQQDNDARSIQLADLCIQKLIDHKLYDPSRVIFISFSLAACKHLAVVAPEFTNQYLNGELSPDQLKEFGINGLDYNTKVFKKHPEWVSRAHELGMSVNVWTVNKEEDIKQMIELGVDCITTNEPLLVRKLLNGNEIKSK